MENSVQHSSILRDSVGYDDTFRNWLKNVATPPVIQFTPYSATFTYNFVTDPVKKFIRSIITLILELGEMGFCLSTRSLKRLNLVVLRDECKLRNGHLVPHTPSNAETSFKTVRLFIIEKVFKNQDIIIPHDMWNLLETMENPRGREYFIQNHIALMNDRAIGSYICLWRNIIYQFNPIEKQKYKDLCDQLPHLTDWCNLFKGITPFEGVYKKDQYKENKGTHQPRFFRNALQHLLEYSKDNDDNPEYLHDELVKMVIAVFPESVCALHELLDEEGLLQLMTPHEYFR